MKRIIDKLNSDYRPLLFLAVIATAVRLFLTNGLMIMFSSGSLYDDLMQFYKAVSIAGGNWLGEYGPLTLVKGVGYPLMTAAIHKLNLPYILTFHFIYVIGCVIFIYAVFPLFRNYVSLFAAYIFILFNPIAFSNNITRYYRDIAYYGLCMICISLIIAMLVRMGSKSVPPRAHFCRRVLPLCMRPYPRRLPMAVYSGRRKPDCYSYIQYMGKQKLPH